MNSARKHGLHREDKMISPHEFARHRVHARMRTPDSRERLMGLAVRASIYADAPVIAPGDTEAVAIIVDLADDALLGIKLRNQIANLDIVSAKRVLLSARVFQRRAHINTDHFYTLSEKLTEFEGRINYLEIGS